MKRNNELHKIKKAEAKAQSKAEDVKICKEYIEHVNRQEQKKIEELQKRENKIQQFMTKMEQSVVAEENKKQKFLEDNIRKNQEKKDKEDYLEEERRKKNLMDM